MTVAVPACIRFPNCRTRHGSVSPSLHKVSKLQDGTGGGPCLLNWQCFHTAVQALDDASMAGFRMYGPGQLAGRAGSVLLWARPGQGSMPGGAVIS